MKAFAGEPGMKVEPGVATLSTLHVDLGRDWRGGQNQVLTLIRGLRARGHGADLIAVCGSPLATRAAAEGVKVTAVSHLVARLEAAFKLRRLMTSMAYDVVHTHEAHALTAAWLAGAPRRAVSVTARRLVYPLGQNRWALARYRGQDCVLAVSRFVAESVARSGVAAERISVAYDGVELPVPPSRDERLRARAHWGATSDAPLVGCVGYLLPDKGQEPLIRAMPSVLTEFPACSLCLAGDGPLRSQLERLAGELGVKDAVRFLGLVDDVTALYAAVDVFVFPSIAEGLGSSLLAAMAYALPVVAVGQCAVPEVINDERQGLLVDTPDPSALSAALLQTSDRIARCTKKEKFT